MTLCHKLIRLPPLCIDMTESDWSDHDKRALELGNEPPAWESGKTETSIDKEKAKEVFSEFNSSKKTETWTDRKPPEERTTLFEKNNLDEILSTV